MFQGIGTLLTYWLESRDELTTVNNSNTNKQLNNDIPPPAPILALEVKALVPPFLPIHSALIDRKNSLVYQNGKV